MTRVQLIDTATHTVLLEGDCLVAAEQLRRLMTRFNLTAVDAAHVSGDVILDAPAPAPVAADSPPGHGRRGRRHG